MNSQKHLPAMGKIRANIFINIDLTQKLNSLTKHALSGVSSKTMLEAKQRARLQQISIKKVSQAHVGALGMPRPSMATKSGVMAFWTTSFIWGTSSTTDKASWETLRQGSGGLGQTQRPCGSQNMCLTCKSSITKYGTKRKRSKRDMHHSVGTNVRHANASSPD